MKTKKIPMRRCISCRENKPKKELVRIVRSKEGDISLDLTGKKSGRGAYICNSKECFTLAREKGHLSRAFSCSIPSEVYDQMEEAIGKNE